MDALVDLKLESVKKRGVKIWLWTPQTDKTRRHVGLQQRSLSPVTVVQEVTTGGGQSVPVSVCWN